MLENMGRVPQNMGHMPQKVVAHATIMTNLPHTTKYGARATKCGAYATKSCIMHRKVWHIPQNHHAHATKSCGTYRK